MNSVANNEKNSNETLTFLSKSEKLLNQSYIYDSSVLGKRLRLIRKKRGYTQEKLADQLYLSVDSISNYENGKTTCMPEHITKICQILNVSADYLYFGIERDLYEKSSKQLDSTIRMIQNCSSFDLNKIYNMIQILLLEQPSVATE